MNRMELIKKRLSNELKNCGMTQTQLAKRINTSQSCIAHYIRGDISPAIDTLAEICNILDIDANYILGLENKNEYKTYENNNFNNFNNCNNFGNINFNNK